MKLDEPTSPDLPTAETVHAAASCGDLAALTRLFDAGADVQSRDAQGRTPLLVAAREGQVEAARLLLDRGAEVDAQGETLGITPLMAAARRDDAVPLVRLLLGAGADVNASARNGAGALARAIVGGNEETVQALLDSGADPNGAGPATAPPNTAPLWVAVSLKRRDLVEVLLHHGAEVNTGDSFFGTPFTIAVSGGDAEIARSLLEAGADPSRPSLVNLPLLAVALKLKNPPMARLLEEHGLSLAQSEEVGEEAGEASKTE